MRNNVRRGGIGAVLVLALGLMGCAQLFGPQGEVSQAPGLPDSGSDALVQGQVLPDRWIVVLKPGVDPQATAQEMAARYGGAVRHVYRFALNGFALQVPAQAAQRIAQDPRVLFISQDKVRRISQGPPPGKGPGGGSSQPPQEVPTGIDRIEVDKLFDLANTTVSVGVEVAIIDSGIDADHPDLNVLGGVNFTGGNPNNWNDGNGHGTHVAGTVAALDNDIGVVGVAPGAGLWAVKVCNNGGLCASSDIIAGIDWVTERADRIAVANMSLGGSGEDDGNCGLTNNDAEHLAICNSVAAGVAYAVAAGNDSADASGFTPAAYDEVLTVSAIADFDGKGGGLASPTCRSDEDDTLANFSNYGADVDLAMPGVCIYSTWNDGGYNTISGTSMASPHAAGLLALYIELAGGRDRDGDGDVDADDVFALYNDAKSNGNPCDFLDDSGDGIKEPLGFANATALGGDGTCD